MHGRWQHELVDSGTWPRMRCFVAVAGALHLAGPRSIWARRRYAPERMEHATRRATRIDDRWRPAIDRRDSPLGGVPCSSKQPVDPAV